MFFVAIPWSGPILSAKPVGCGTAPVQPYVTMAVGISLPGLRRNEMARTRKSPIRIRLRVANRPGQVFRAGKGRGSYRRAAARVQITRQQADD